ncbi:cysteine--tRNA ligase [Hellea balneolensis]|uniref:cysteine--tRNA ligase n=1 Tax=Hellea balneolensis TaxID=287478 RepID=UPI00040B590C|nr:cysteine--tRNA ligase [Hellea balneolensis]
MTEKPQLTLYNSLTRQKKVFTPQDPKRVTMYNCGPTVYSYAHIGNARAAVVADVLFRVLRHIYGEEHVIYARNITDVDDKIIESAKEQGVDISVITEKYANIYNEDLAAIGCLPPTEQPKATESIDEMQDIIVELMDKNIAYFSEGHILFDVTRMDEYAKEKKMDTRYGKLSGRKLEDNLAGARVEVASYKRNAGDFVLWKPAKDDEPGWDFKNYGRGRPGWHIECSAMIRDVLGETIDIHCGGIDLKFPHHENEIAQSHCANDKPLANFWVHNEFLNMGKDKMSKSLGNVKLIHDLLKDWDGEVIRLALLTAHYRSELIWTEKLLEDSKAQLDRWYRSAQKLNVNFSEIEPIPPTEDFGHPFADNVFDDLNAMFGWMYYYNIIDYVIENKDPSMVVSSPRPNIDERKKQKWISRLSTMMNLLGLLQKDPEEWFKGGLDYDALVEEYDSVRAQALAAKEAGDKAKMGEMFKRSDEIRDQFKAEGVVIESGSEGKSSWRKG